MDIRQISAAETRTVRLPVLRAGLPPESAILAHDDDPGTFHFGAFDGGRLVGVATFFPDPYPASPKRPAWRLRGMATLPEVQRRGAGRALIAAGVAAATAAGAELMWCNARITAQGFYELLGFVAVGDQFLEPTSGPHYVMVKELRTGR